MSRDRDADSEDRSPQSEARKLARQVEANDWKWLMSSKQGRRIAWRLLAETGIHRTSFTGNSETFFREGRRDVGLFIEREITHNAFEGYIQMLTESKATAESKATTA